MPRHPRTHLDDMPLHIVQRGHNRNACFFTDEDYLAYKEWLGEALRNNGCQLHAYVLMTNHVHLLLTPEKAAGVPKLIIALGRRYVQYINKTYRRTGTLWDSRYKSSLIQVETYLLACMRYIELNPVRAGMVGDPADYRWSSYRTNGIGLSDPLVTPHTAYQEIDPDNSLRRQAYRELFRPHLDAPAIADIRQALDQSSPLGDSRFHAAIETVIGERRQPRPRGRPRKEKNDLLSQQT